VPQGERGLVIASASFRAISGTTPHAYPLPDCGGKGLGVVVESVGADRKFLYDQNGEPCQPAVTMFDGQSPLARRGADPAIAITLHDKLGPLHDQPGDRIPHIIVNGDAPAAVPPPAPVASPADPLVSTLTAWRRQDDQEKRLVANHIARETERSAAAARQISRLGQAQARQSQDAQLNTLLGQLRDTERRLQTEQNRHALALAEQSERQNQTQAVLTRWQQDEEQLKDQLNATRQRLAEVEGLSQHLAVEKTRQQKAYEQRLVTLSGDLKAAEAKASESRQELILQAARKVAEAQALADAAKLSEADTKAREAARLKAESDQLLDQALDLSDGRPRGLPSQKPAPLSLADTPVVVHLKDQPLDNIVNAILAQAKPQAGEWHADWQLSKEAQYILHEKWSLTAEAPVRALLQNLTAQVQSTHQIRLKFTQFSQSRLLVVTDEK
jgi:hypothetical protein